MTSTVECFHVGYADSLRRGTMNGYDDRFYDTFVEGSMRSARIVVPIIMDIFHPASVADLGCGVGAWLKVFLELGTKDVLGIDSSGASFNNLLIDKSSFLMHDLTTDLALMKRYDLAICIEVGEHLPPEAATTLVRNLARLSDVVVFSAAIPGQGGVQHINEQWPRYWAELFAGEGYEAWDELRWKIWDEGDVEWWYAQNLIIYLKRSSSRPELKELMAESMKPRALDVVHPRAFGTKLEEGVRAVEDVHRTSAEEIAAVRNECARTIESIRAESIEHRLIQLIDRGIRLMRSKLR